MKRYINFRPILFCAVSFSVGILFAGYYPFLGALTFIIPTVATAAVVGLYSLLYKDGNIAKAAITGAVCALFCAFGSLGLLIRVEHTVNSVVESGVYRVSGEVRDIYSDGENSTAILGDCSVGGEKTSDICVSGIGADVDVYDRFTAKCKVKSVEKTDDGKYSFAVLSGEGMTAEPVGEISVSKGGDLRSAFAKKADEIFSVGLGGEEGKVAVAMFTGLTYGMGESLFWYRMTGLAHVFAVSGLHIGLLFSAVSLILKAVRVNGAIRATLASVAAFFYAYLCGMTASCVRAAVMCSLYSVALASSKKPDKLNSFAFAVFAVLAIRPGDLFSLGFIMSFSVGLSLIVVAPPIKRFLGFLPPKFDDAFATIAAAELAVLPVCVICFGHFPLIAILSNALLIPVLTAVYYLLWVGFILSAVGVPPLYALAAPRVLLIGTNAVANRLADFKFGIKTMPSPLVFTYAVPLALSSDAFNFGKKTKITFAATTFATILLCLILSYS